ELRGGDRQRHVLLAGHLTHAQPAGTDLHTLGEDAEVGLIVGRLVGDRHDGDVGTDGEGPELALVVAVVVLGDGSDGSHDANPLACPAEAYSPAGAREIVAGWSLRHPKRRLRRAGTGTQWRTRRRRVASRATPATGSQKHRRGNGRPVRREDRAAWRRSPSAQCRSRRACGDGHCRWERSPQTDQEPVDFSVLERMLWTPRSTKMP